MLIITRFAIFFNSNLNLQSIPTGDWFCDVCRPKEKVKSPQKKRRIYKEESEDEEEEQSEEEEEEER